MSPEASAKDPPAGQNVDPSVTTSSVYEPTASAATSEQEKDAQGNPIEPATDFVTTSYVLDSLNTALNKLNLPTSSCEEEEEESSSSNNAVGEKRTFFELQKRLPDGSTRKATDEEMSSADMKNKLEQAAKFTEKMTHAEKIEWAHKQRQYGNQLYKEGSYKEAIDIYLTCLVVRDMSQQEVDQEVLILPVMNNLAQCTLQLGWYQKTEHFCTIAMESLDDATSKGPLVSKLYFKRAKARRLRGMYKEARVDLEIASLKLGVDDGNSIEKEEEEEGKTPEQKAIEREFQLLAKSNKEGMKNKQRAQRAMKKVLGKSGQTDEKKTEESPSIGVADSSPANKTTEQQISESHDGKAAAHARKTSNQQDYHNIDDDDTPLYHEKHVRTHSTVRKRPEGPPPYGRATLPVDLSYWQMYRLIVARVAQRLLDIIGDDEGTGLGGSNDEQVDRPKED